MEIYQGQNFNVTQVVVLRSSMKLGPGLVVHNALCIIAVLTLFKFEQRLTEFFSFLNKVMNLSFISQTCHFCMGLVVCRPIYINNLARLIFPRNSTSPQVFTGVWQAN